MPRKKVPSGKTALTTPAPADFDNVLRLIDEARGRAVAAVNKELIDLYWNIGEHISRKIAADGWGKEPSRPWPNSFGGGSPTPGVSQPVISGG